MHVRERKMCFFLPWAHSYPGKPEESDSPGTVDTGTWEPSDMVLATRLRSFFSP